jgi:peptidoglycan/LPS O-acetylase OafA/YrhL
VFGGTPVFARGYLAVEFFLMLSGFLMAYAQEARLTQPVRFMARRYLRLWPVMALGGLIGLPRLFALSDSVADFAAAAVLNLALLPVWWGTFAFPLNIPAWTIFYELVANALHVFLFRRVRLSAICLGIVLLAPIMVGIGMLWNGFDVGARSWDFAVGLPRILFAYLIGVALGRIWRERPPPPIPPLLAIPAMPAILALGWWLGLDRTWHFDMLFTVIACPLMIAGGMRLARFHRAAGLAGQLSFPLFAVQMPILEGTRMLGWGGWQGGFAALGGGIAVALLAHALGTWRKEKTV